MLDQGDPLIEKSTGVKFYFYAWSDDSRKVGFKFNLKETTPYAKCFSEQQWKEFTKANLHNIFSEHTQHKRENITKIFLNQIYLSKIKIDDIAVIRSEQIQRRKQEEWQCKTLKDWYKLAAKRGHKPFWAKKRWELRKKQWKPASKYKMIKLKGELDKDINDDKYFNF